MLYIYLCQNCQANNEEGSRFYPNSGTSSATFGATHSAFLNCYIFKKKFWVCLLGNKKGPRSFPSACLLAAKFTAPFNQVRLTFPAFAYYPANPARRSLSSLSSRSSPVSLTCQSISGALFRVPHYSLFLILWLTRSTAETPFDISSGFVFIHSLPMPDFRLILWVP